jgi:hypothetical protein
MSTFELSSKNIKDFLLSCKDKGIFQNISFKDISLDYADEESVCKALEGSYKISIDPVYGNLQYTDGDEVYNCPRMRDGLSAGKEWISDKIPSCPFQTYFDGNLRKQLEAESLFTCIVLSSIFKEPYSSEFDVFCKSYDFGLMSGVDKESSFFNLQKNWQEAANSSAFNLVVYSVNKRLTEQKKEDFSSFTKELDLDSQIGLGELIQLKKNIFFDSKYSGLEQLSRVKRLVLIDQRDTEINELMLRSSYSELYYIVNLSSSEIPPGIQKTIRSFARSEAVKLVEHYPECEREFFAKKFARRLTRDAFKQRLNELKTSYIEVYKVWGENYFEKLGLKPGAVLN